jgi:hypothetical protein
MIDYMTARATLREDLGADDQIPSDVPIRGGLSRYFADYVGFAAAGAGGYAPST